MAVIHIKDSESFLKYQHLLDELGDPVLCSTMSISSSNKPYGIFKEKLGWVKEITIITTSREVNVVYTASKQDALAIRGSLLGGSILLHGQCILL